MRWLLPFFTVFLMLGLAIPDAEARRMGGGKSFGAAPAHKSQPVQRQQAPREQQAAPRNQAAGQAAAASGASRWLGPIAAITAGGLLASMLFGDGFEGIQLFDILILGLIAFVLFKLFARRPAAAMQPQPATAGAAYREQPSPWAPTNASAGNPQPTAAAEPSLNAPAWFNAQSFIMAAEEHFFTLQRHWRDGDTAGMAEYMTPGLLQDMLEARNEHPPAANGFVEQLTVRLDGVEEVAGTTIATVSFNGLDRDAPQDEGIWFDESWRLERAGGENQPWIISGIRQNV